MTTRKAWVLYDNNGISSFSVYQDRNDPKLLQALKDNPRAKVRGVSFQLSDFGMERMPLPEICPAIVYKISALQFTDADSYIGNLNTYRAVSKKTGLSFEDKSLPWVIHSVEVSDKANQGGKNA
jgi:hypothetical protein